MSSKRLGVRAALTDGGLIPGDVLIEDGMIASAGARPAGRAGTAVPGYIDLQVNGFGGVDFLSTDESGFRRAGEALAATGVTAFQPTLITAPEPTLLTSLGVAARAAIDSRPRLLGVHLEACFLSPKWRGAHDARWLGPPDIALAERFLEAGPVTYVTIAPELPGGFDLLDRLVRGGAVVAIGHSDADGETAHAAFNRGARAVTHLHNAHRRFTARDPGIAGVALTRPDVTVGLIVDFVHLAREAVLMTWFAARGRVALVTDAIAAAPESDGEVSLGGRTVRVEDGVARLPDGTLAGSVLTMDRAVRNVVSLGVPLGDAIAAATLVPARLVGREELGTLRSMSPADIAVLDDRLEVVRTFVAGDEVWASD